tara:strand:+ start:35 stop:193 length:159 start_codon:yes stop_codon:yes gene_type:complete
LSKAAHKYREIIKTTSEVYKALVLIILVYLDGTKSKINATTNGKQIKVDNTE